MIKVLIVDDSPVMLELLRETLSADPKIKIIGFAENGQQAFEFVEKEKPDVITMDVNMPVMNGLDATRKIMENYPTPIIIVSANFSPTDIKKTFMAFEFGAVSVSEKPRNYGTPEYDRIAKQLCQNIKLMSEIKVVKRVAKNKQIIAPKTFAETRETSFDDSGKIDFIAIGTSTGGPVVLEKILSGLKSDFSIPILIVQHIAKGFTKGLVDWLNNNSKVKVVVGESSQKIEPAHCYVAPDDRHMTLDSNLRIRLNSNPPEYSLRPAVSAMFRSIAENKLKNCVSILLTGMGRDGAAELKMIKDIGAVTIAQNEESSTVFGMPGEAVKLNAASHIYSPEQIINYLNKLNL